MCWLRQVEAYADHSVETQERATWNSWNLLQQVTWKDNIRSTFKLKSSNIIQIIQAKSCVIFKISPFWVPHPLEAKHYEVPFNEMLLIDDSVGAADLHEFWRWDAVRFDNLQAAAQASNLKNTDGWQGYHSLSANDLSCNGKVSRLR